MDDRGRLDPPFVEWLMGLPAGWTDVPGATRAHRLCGLGGAVVPQQGIAAFRWLLDHPDLPPLPAV